MSGSTRREFMKTASAGVLAASLSAASYRRVKGANDRIGIGVIGCGARGYRSIMPSIHEYSEETNVEITAVCDPWRLRREEAALACKEEWYGREPKQFVSYTDLVALDDVDAVVITSCDHQHTTHMEAAARAGKDIYVEKPISMDMESLNAAYDAAKENNLVVQAGTQLRSMDSLTGVRKLVREGALGNISRIEQCRNSSRPYWYQYVQDVEEDDVDWAEFLMDRPMRPFDPNLYSGWYGYREFSDGPVPGLGSHFVDLVHYFTGATFPESAVCLGGIYSWIDEYEFTCPDHIQAQWIYPEGFMVSYSTNFGNGSGNSCKIFGDRGVIDMPSWGSPTISGAGVFDRGDAVVDEEEDVEPVEHPHHTLDWLRCLRTRETPNASLDAGYQHTVAGLMAMKAFDTGKRQVFDQERREIREG